MADGRWPQWSTTVAELGIASMLAAELIGSQAQRLGSINVYWSHPRTFTADDIAFVNIFARHAAHALAGSLDKAGLGMALDSRKRIGQAQGILMERYGLDEARAFEVLRRYSQDHNIKLRYVAEHLITARHLPTPPHVDNEPADTGQSG
jgi:GAF domain-containing protein